MKQIIYFKEHHGSIALDFSTPEQQQRAALSVVRGRFSGNNPYYPMDPPEEPKQPDFAEEDIDKLPASMQAAARVQYDQYKRAQANYAYEKRMQDAIKRCLDANDGKLALRIIMNRQSNCDEGYEVIEVYNEYPSGDE